MTNRGQEDGGDPPLAAQGDDGPVVALFVRLLLNLGGEGDGAHDSVAKLLVQHRLVR